MLLASLSLKFPAKCGWWCWGVMVWSMKWESALCHIHGNFLMLLASFMLIFNLSATCHLWNSLAGNQVCCALPGSHPAYCISQQIWSYQNLNMAMFAFLTVFKACWKLLFAHGIEIWVPKRAFPTLGPCSNCGHLSHTTVSWLAAMFTLITLDSFCCHHVCHF